MEVAPSKIKKGYKQTEVGVIPEEWEVCELSEAVDFLDGLRRPVKSSDRAKIKGIYPYYGASGIVDYVDDYIFDDDLILLGEDGENILSRNLPLAFQVHGKIWVNNHAHVLKPKSTFVIKYLTDFLENLDYSLLNSGTAQPKLNKRACMQIKVVKPEIPEQQAIATALSDTDELIQSLDALIKKKKNIKTATMQQLLSGKARLPGFKREWECIELGLLLDYEQPTKYLVSSTKYSDAYSTPVLTVGKTFVLGYTNEPVGIFKDLPCIIFDDFTTESRFVDFPFKAKSSAMKMLLPKSETVNLRYVFEAMQEVGFKLGDHKRYWISEYRHLKIPLPGPEEQEAIVEVLVEMELEISSLKKQRDKLNSLKQGMMHELLAGNTRLV